MADGFAGTSIFRISLTFTDRTLSVLQLGYKSEDSTTLLFFNFSQYSLQHNNRAYVGRGSWKKLISPSFCHPSNWELNSLSYDNFHPPSFLNYSLLIQSPDLDWLPRFVSIIHLRDPGIRSTPIPSSLPCQVFIFFSFFPDHFSMHHLYYCTILEWNCFENYTTDPLSTCKSRRKRAPFRTSSTRFRLDRGNHGDCVAINALAKVTRAHTREQ